MPLHREVERLLRDWVESTDTTQERLTFEATVADRDLTARAVASLLSTHSQAWMLLRSSTLGQAELLTPDLVESALLSSVRADDSVSLIDLTAHGGVGFDVSLERDDELVLQVSGWASGLDAAKALFELFPGAVWFTPKSVKGYR